MRALALVSFGLLWTADGDLPGGAVRAADGEGDEEEHTPTPTPPTPHPPRVTPSARPQAVLKDGMARVTGGTFTVGSNDAKARPNEKPARVVTLASFWIDRTEVTVAAYRACVDAKKCAPPARSSTDCTYDRGDPLLPVSCVTWEMAREHCAFVGKRLPREIEWEVAARGHSPVRYPWGGSTTSCGAAITLVNDATQKSCGKKGPARVGSRPNGASPFGVLDLSGNVEEWVADWYGETTSEPPHAGASHVLRGGGWMSIPSMAKTTSRNWGSSREAGANVGFRCARDD